MSEDKLNISPADIDALKAPDVLHSYCRAALGEGKKKGRLTFYRCPWGAHTRPKLEVTERDGVGVAICRACNNTGGTVFDVAAGVLGLHVKRDFPAVVKAVADAVGYTLRDSTEDPPKKGRRTRKKSRSCCSAVVTKAAPVPPVEEPLEFLPQDEEAAALDAVHRLAGDADAQARFADLLGLPLDVVKFHTDIQESGALGLLGMDERGRLLYVYTHCPAAGEPPRVVGVKTRNPQGVEPRFLMRGRKRDLWGIDAAADARLVIITEGESDALAGRSAFWAWLEDRARNEPESYPSADTLPAVVGKPDAGTFKESWARKLKGKEVILIADNDEAGREGAEKTASMLHAAGARHVFMWNPPDGIKDARAALEKEHPEKLAQDIWNNKKACTFMTKDSKEESEQGPPVICLGRDGTEYVLYSTAYKRTDRLTAEKMTRPNLIAIAPRDRWEAWLFPERVAAGDEVKRGELVDAAQEWILAESGAKRFDDSRMRARGVWPDSARGWVYNAGAVCWFIPADGGNIEQVDHVRGDYVYSAGVELPAPAADPLTDAEGRHLLELISSRPWVIPGSGEIAAGWKVAAMLAGVMPICPHLWINAPAGTGKTYLKNDIADVLGRFSMTQEGVPTDAGIRQRLAGDAVPVLLDEVEQGDNEASGKKISKLLDLMRSASYGKDPITKGGADGKARLYPMKCGFALFSIANCISRDADSSRCLVLHLCRGGADVKEMWKKQEPGRALVKSPGFHGRLIARLLRGLPVLMQNIAALTKHLRSLEGVDSRRGELFAVLMACRYALTSSGPLTPEQMQHAADILRAYGEQEEQRSDSEKCLSHLLGYVIRARGQDMTVAAACRVLYSRGDIETQAACELSLEAAGLKWKENLGGLQVGTPLEDKMKRIFAGTQWSNGKVAAVLAEGADRDKGRAGANRAGIWYHKAKLGRATSSRCVIIPAVLILPEHLYPEQ